MLYLKFKYGKDEFKAQYPHDPNGIYSAYMQNFFISLLFITQLWRQGNTRGVNMGVAICKMLGTIAPSTLGGIG